jgi:hypothetical protein
MSIKFIGLLELSRKRNEQAYLMHRKPSLNLNSGL